MLDPAGHALRSLLFAPAAVSRVCGIRDYPLQKSGLHVMPPPMAQLFGSLDSIVATQLDG